MKAYDKIFDWYVCARSPEAGGEVIRKFTQNLHPGAKILDLGCGYGSPIANTLYQIGFKPLTPQRGGNQHEKLQKITKLFHFLW